MSPRTRTDLLVNDFTWRALHEGRIELYEGAYRRNYLHVRDAARVFLHAIDHFPRLAGRIFNVGLSDANLSKRELCERIRGQLPKLQVIESAAGRDPDQRNYIVSNARIEATGFRAAHSLDDGIRELIGGYAKLRGARGGNT
jgi:nucleoside-diphosphate-sugar epimerase